MDEIGVVERFKPFQQLPDDGDCFGRGKLFFQFEHIAQSGGEIIMFPVFGEVVGGLHGVVEAVVKLADMEYPQQMGMGFRDLCVVAQTSEFPVGGGGLFNDLDDDLLGNHIFGKVDHAVGAFAAA